MSTKTTPATDDKTTGAKTDNKTNGKAAGKPSVPSAVKPKGGTKAGAPNESLGATAKGVVDAANAAAKADPTLGVKPTTKGASKAGAAKGASKAPAAAKTTETGTDPKAANKAAGGAVKGNKTGAAKAGAKAADAPKADGKVLTGELLKADTPKAAGTGQLAIAFDYNALDTETRKLLRGHETAIKAAMKRTQNDVVEIGKRLIDAKNSLDMGQFGKWCEGIFGINRVAANRFMGVAEHFSTLPAETLQNFQTSALYALSSPSVPQEVRDAAQKLAETGQTVTHGKAQEMTGKATPSATTAPAPTNAPEAGKTAVGIVPPGGGAVVMTPAGEAAPAATADDASGLGDDATADTTGTTTDAPMVDGTSDEAYVKGLPLFAALDAFPTNQDVFLADAMAVREYLQGGLAARMKAFANAAIKTAEETSPLMGDGLDLLKMAANIKDPAQWELCVACKGCGQVWIANKDASVLEPGSVASTESNQLDLRAKKVKCTCTNQCGYSI